MTLNIQNLKKEKTQIIGDINRLRKQRNSFVKKITSSNRAYKKRLISYKEYEGSLKKVLGNNSFEKYLHENVLETNNLKRKLDLINHKLDVKSSNRLSEFLLLFSLFVFVGVFFYLDPTITGLTILESNTTDNLIQFQLEINKPAVWKITALASTLNVTLLSPINTTNISKLIKSTTLNVSVEHNSTRFLVYAGNSTDLDFNNIVLLNKSIFGSEVYNITYNLSALPLKPQTNGSDGLILLYHFDNTSSENYRNGTNFTIIDFSTADNNGTGVTNSSSGGSQFNQSGRFGGALEFDGEDDFINSTDSNKLEPAEISVFAWVNFKSFANTPIIVKKGTTSDTPGKNGYHFRVSGTTLQLVLYTGTNTENILSGGNPALDLWNHLGFTYNSTTARVYINGIETGNTAYSSAIDYTGGEKLFLIGAGQGDGMNGFFNGTIDELAVWNRSLNDTEISNLYNLTAGKYYWKSNITDQVNESHAENRTLNTGIFEFNIGVNPNNPVPFIFPNPAYRNSSLNASYFVEDPDNDPINLEIVFWNGTREHFRVNLTNLANSTNASYTLVKNITNNFSKEQNWTASFRAYDGTSSSEWINVSRFINNSFPSFNSVISNSTWNEDSNLTNVSDLNVVFTDPENDTLTFTSLGNSAIDVVIDNFKNISYYPQPNWFGAEVINISAYDGNDTIYSNLITLTVTEISESAPSVTTVTGRSTRLVGLDVVIPSPISMQIFDKVVVPIIIRNDKDVTLTNIQLLSQPSSNQLRTLFKKTTIPKLLPGQQEVIDLEITSSKAIEENKYSILLTAFTNTESAVDTAEFFVNIADFGSANRSLIIPRLQFAKDLFNSNPKCIELSELLKQAEESLDLKQFDKSGSLIENAIKSCSDLLSFTPEKIETPSKKSNEKLILVIELVILTAAISGFVFYIKRRRSVKF